jgi:hypothetical protein
MEDNYDRIVNMPELLPSGINCTLRSRCLLGLRHWSLTAINNLPRPQHHGLE